MSIDLKKEERIIQDHWYSDPTLLFPGVNISCIIFGFDEGELKILLHRVVKGAKWMLPGGFIELKQDLNDAAEQILLRRTGLKEVYLKQFYAFGKADRSNREKDSKELSEIIAKQKSFAYTTDNWFNKRFITIAYYSFVDFNKVNIEPIMEEDLAWFSLKDLPDLYSDHNEILDEAIKELRRHIGKVPFGLELLPKKFTMTELRTIYEMVLDRMLDRRNFQRKMLSTGYVIKLNEMIQKQGIKASNLFSFDKVKYDKGISIFE